MLRSRARASWLPAGRTHHQPDEREEEHTEDRDEEGMDDDADLSFLGKRFRLSRLHAMSAMVG